jgi:hypothetical protein
MLYPLSYGGRGREASSALTTRKTPSLAVRPALTVVVAREAAVLRTDHASRLKGG